MREGYAREKIVSSRGAALLGAVRSDFNAFPLPGAQEEKASLSFLVSLSFPSTQQSADLPKVTAPFLLASFFSLLSRHFNSVSRVCLTVTLMLSGPRGTRACQCFFLRSSSFLSLPSSFRRSSSLSLLLSLFPHLL